MSSSTAGFCFGLLGGEGGSRTRGGKRVFGFGFALGLGLGLFARDVVPGRVCLLDSSSSWLQASKETRLPEMSARLTAPASTIAAAPASSWRNSTGGASSAPCTPCSNCHAAQKALAACQREVKKARRCPLPAGKPAQALAAAAAAAAAPSEQQSQQKCRAELASCQKQVSERASPTRQNRTKCPERPACAPAAAPTAGQGKVQCPKCPERPACTPAAAPAAGQGKVQCPKCPERPACAPAAAPAAGQGKVQCQETPPGAPAKAAALHFKHLPERHAHLCRVAHRTAINSQVLLLIGDKNMFQPPGKNDTLIAEMLHSLMRYRVNNILLVATDGPGYRQGLKWIEYVKPQISLHVIHREIPTPGVLASREIRETMSAKKFEVIKDLMVCNIHVLLSDFDVIFWDNPFKHLIGDADLEGMTDGWEYETQYGWHVNTWKGGPWWADRWFAPWEWRVVFLNSGFFYIRASNKTAQTMAATWQMLTLENIWDQAAFNAQIRAPLGTPKDCRLHGQGLSIRIMDPYKFSNSRVFNTIIDKSENAKSHFNPTLKYPVPRFHWPTPSGKPVAVHVNYHWFKVAVLAWARKVFDNVHRNGSAVPRNGTAQRNSIVNNKRAAVPRNGTAQRNSSVNHKRAAR